jgi:hypothetical protein
LKKIVDSLFVYNLPFNEFAINDLSYSLSFDVPPHVKFTDQCHLINKFYDRTGLFECNNRVPLFFSLLSDSIGNCLIQFSVSNIFQGTDLRERDSSEFLNQLLSPDRYLFELPIYLLLQLKAKPVGLNLKSLNIFLFPYVLSPGSRSKFSTVFQCLIEPVKEPKRTTYFAEINYIVRPSYLFKLKIYFSETPSYLPYIIQRIENSIQIR